MQLRSGKDDETLVNEIGVKTAKLFLLFCSGCRIDNSLHVLGSILGHGALQGQYSSPQLGSLSCFTSGPLHFSSCHFATFPSPCKNEGGHLCFGLAGWIISVS